MPADADIVRLKLDRPHLSSCPTDGSVWTVEIGDSVLEPTHALEHHPQSDRAKSLERHDRRSMQPQQRASASPIPKPAISFSWSPLFAPARGFINEQDFIEFRALASTQGVVIEPLADDINVELDADKVVVGRPLRTDAVDVAADAAARQRACGR